jgi:hypothetical protein
MLLLKRSQTQQPSSAIPINATSNLISPVGGLYISPSYGANFITPNGIPLIGAASAPTLTTTNVYGNALTGGTFASTPFGRGIRPNTGNRGGWIIPAFGSARSGYPAYQGQYYAFTACTVLSLDSLTIGSEPQAIAGVVGAYDATTYAFLARVNPGWGGPAIAVWHGNGTSAVIASIGVSSVPEIEQVGKLLTVFYGYTGTVLWIMVNGVYAEVTQISGVSFASDGSQYCLGGMPTRSDSELALRGVIYMHFMLPGVAIPGTDFKRVAKDPWALFAPRSIYIPTASVGPLPNITNIYADSIESNRVTPRIKLIYP